MIRLTFQNKISEIKHIREYCQERYGNYGGLKEAKELIESIMMRQPPEPESPPFFMNFGF